MPDTSAILDALHGIASRLDEDMTEKDVENAFLNEGFYTFLGYEGTGHDLRSEWTLPDNRRPDYVTLDSNESVTAVYEFKTTGRDLTPNEGQLFHYVDELKADYGVLTNGQEFRLYRREDHTRIAGFSLSEATEGDAADIEAALKKPDWDITDPESVNEFLNQLDEVELDGQLGREHFFETFRLEEDSPFADFVTAMMDLLQELRDEQEAKFVKGAYDFWEASYASIPEDENIPDSWEPFISGDQSIRDFMFCLESGHALLSRLLLAKASDDHDFFPNNKGLRRYFDELGGFSGNIDLDAYPVAANGMIEDMRNQLVQSLFEDDIFIWWTDGFGKQTASQHENPYNRFRDIAKEGSDVSRVSPATRERFSRAIAHVSFAVLKFDFSRIEGDPLGNLYQRYFDPETRKALGEFYTPQPVIDYIMDGVDYEVGISQERIIDPSCGSGTFLVEAVNRYLDDVRRYNDDPDWAEHLTELCTTPHIVGLDIHPFAVLMAQIRFMVAILPEYREAKRERENFTIRRLPIFRTDTLRNERDLTGIDLGDDGQTQMTLDSITEDNQDVKIPVPLPIEVDEDEVSEGETEDGFLVQRVRMPKYDTAKMQAGVRNFGEYYAALQGVLDVVKFHMQENWWEYGGGLEEGIHRYTTREYDGVEDFFEPYVNDILATVRYLREDHGDGRLFKMFEDSVLALVVKNYMEYDYVVGNPPYVRQENIPQETKAMLEELYPDIYSGRGDLSIYFLRRSVQLLSENGNVGLIVPNKFTKLGYGENTRKYLSESVEIKDVLDFADADVFEDATAYAMIMVAEKRTPRDDNQFSTCVIDSSIEEVDDPVSYVFDHIGETTDYIWSFDVRQSRIGSEEWRFIPEHIHQISDKIRDNATHDVDDVGSVVMGMRPGMNDAFIIEDETAEEHDIEQEVLRECIKGKDVEPFHLPLTDRKVIYTPEVDPNKHENALDFISQFEGELRDREQFKSRDDMEWWEIEQPVSAEIFDRQKIISPSFSKRNSFAYDDRGVAHVDTVMSVLLDEYYDDEETRYHVLGILNSRPVEIIFKQSASVYQQRYYRYYQQHIEPLPLVIPDDVGEYDVAEKTKQIVEANRLGDKRENFPNAYLDDYDGDLGYIDYEWQTRRYPVNASIQQKSDGRYAVTAGNSDEITDPLMDRGNTEEQKLRAKYVHTAVNGRNMKKGEEQTIPIPLSRDGVEQLIERAEEDSQHVDGVDTEELESEIDQIVYELFGLSDDEQEVIEDYLEVF